MNKIKLFLSTFLILVLASCNKDDDPTITDVKVAFVNQNINLTVSENQVDIVFSSPTPAAGSITLAVVPTSNLIYGTDFTTIPAVTNNLIIVPFSSNTTSTNFTFNKLTNAIEGEIKNVKFTITSITVNSINIPSQTNYTQLNFNEAPINFNTTITESGGNTFPNGIYVDLSSGQKTTAGRTSWDLGFYSGTDYRVVLNPGINKLAVKQLSTSNIDEVQYQDSSVTTGDYNPIGAAYIDNPTGSITGTSITEISANDNDNKVYLVNLGVNVSNTPATGANAEFLGTARGWKKIRIVRNGNDYKLQYADIDATSHSEITIPKNAIYNHTFFSFTSNAVVNVEPLKEKWDLLVTPYISYTSYNGANVSYYFGDGILSNNLAGTKIYQVLTSEFIYSDFNISNVVMSNFETTNAQDRRAIGTSWRTTYPSASVKTDRFYVVKDVAGNIYKIKFNSLLSTLGTRGTTTFEYVRLN